MEPTDRIGWSACPPGQLTAAGCVALEKRSPADWPTSVLAPSGIVWQRCVVNIRRREKRTGIGG